MNRNLQEATRRVHRVAAAAIGLALLLTVAQVCAAQESILYNFRGSNSSDGSVPLGLLIRDAAGNFYGVTNSGGSVGEPYDTNGTVFELSPQAGGVWQETVLYSFGMAANDGAGPADGLVADADGNLYGTTHLGGTHGAGTAFELSPGKGGIWTEKVLYNFGAYGTDAAQPHAGLIFDAEGNLYGTTQLGGSYTVSNGMGVQLAGTVFELVHQANDTWKEKVLYRFGATQIDGQNPLASLIFDGAGNLYGTTVYGGNFSSGTAFKLAPQANGTWKETVIHSFDLNGVDGSMPEAALVFDAQGNLYGTTYGGGSNPYSGGLGAVYELSPAPGGEWAEQVLCSFAGLDGNYPISSLAIDGAGNLYGTSYLALYGFGRVYRVSPGPGGWTKTTLYSFNDTPDGWEPAAGVIFDAEGNLYGTASTGGAYAADSGLGGTIYEISAVATASPTISPAGGSYATARTVKLADTTAKAVIYYTTDGSTPTVSSAKYTKPFGAAESQTVKAMAVAAGLPQSFTASATYLIGKTAAEPEISPAPGFFTAPLTVTLTDTTAGAAIHYTTNGTIPTAASRKYTGALTVSSNETVQAIAVASGFADSVVASAEYAVAPGPLPIEKVLHSFGTVTNDGGEPIGGLIEDGRGDLFGTTEYGGTNTVQQGNNTVGVGTVFELLPSTNGGWTEKVLYNFGANSDDGANPMGGVVMDAKGNLYGTASNGGKVADGAVFKLTPGAGGTWKETVIYNFNYLTNDGKTPEAGLAIDAKGNLYGTTYQGGGNSVGSSAPGGTVFELSPNADGTWTETLLHSFSYLSQTDGYYPVGPVVFDSKGNLYGTTSDGGSGQDSQGGGIVFELTPTAAGNPWKETILYNFGGGSNTIGYQPLGGLAVDAGGNVYGTTSTGGQGGFGLDGTLFELSPTAAGWQPHILHSFGSDESDGINPKGGLMLDKSGNIYGTTTAGGANGYGNVFELLATSGAELSLHDFNFDGADGLNPHGTPMMDATGNLFGTAPFGGAQGSYAGTAGGVVFELESSTTTQKPVMFPVPGTYAPGQKVEIVDTTPGEVVYYTTDGTTPTTASTRYKGEFALEATATVKAIAVARGFANSLLASAAYTIGTPTAAPAISPAGGTFTAAQRVTITDTTPGAAVYYTVDGTTPTLASPRYAGAFKVSKTTTVKAIAMAPGHPQSTVSKQVYSID